MSKYVQGGIHSQKGYWKHIELFEIGNLRDKDYCMEMGLVRFMLQKNVLSSIPNPQF